MSKVLVSAAGPNMAPMLDCAEPTFERYASEHGYELIIDRSIADHAEYKNPLNKAARWGKIALMKEAVEDYDFAVWFDADTMITKFDKDIADDLPPDAFQGFVIEQSPLTFRRGFNINSGVWPIKGNDKAKAFIQEVENRGMDTTGTWADQAVMSHVLGWELGDDANGNFMARPLYPSEYLKGTTWLPVEWNPTGVAKDFPGRVIHYAGLQNDVRLTLMQEQLQHMRDQEML